MVVKKYLIFILTIGAICHAHAASFDCSTKDLSSIELFICNDPGLSEIDSLLDVYYKYALTNFGAKDELKSSQRHWIEQRNTCSDNYNCIANAYEDRIKQLAAESNLLNPEHVVNPQLFTAAHMLETWLADLPSCSSFEDINLDGKEEMVCLPDCNGAPACSDYFFVSQPKGYRYLPELAMGSYESLLIFKAQDDPIPALEKQHGYKDYTINGWRILYSTYGYIKECEYTVTYYAYSDGAYSEIFSQSLEPPWNSCPN